MIVPRKISSNKDVEKVARAALKRGWTVDRGGRHRKLVAPDGVLFVSIPSSPSCPHSAKNFLRDIERIENGVVL